MNKYYIKYYKNITFSCTLAPNNAASHYKR